MRILVDGRTLVAPSTGVYTFFKGAIMEWARQRPDDDFYIAVPRMPNAGTSFVNYPANIHIVCKSNALLRKLPNLVWLNTVVPQLARQLKADIYYSPVTCIPFFLPHRMKKVIVVHDVVNLEFKETMRWTNRLANALFFSRSIRKADLIWTNSFYTKDKVDHYFPQRRCQDIYTGDAVDTDIHMPLQLTDAQQQSIREKYGISGDYILFVGSLEPRKNLQFLVSLMPEVYRQTATKLVVVGGHGWGKTHIKDIIEHPDFPRESIVFCKFVPDPELAMLYNMARCFVSASLNEGFGMPQLEALYCGCPVVTAHNSAMIEVAKNKTGATTVEGYEPQTWVETIKRVLEERPKPQLEELTEYQWVFVIRHLIEVLTNRHLLVE